MQQLDQAPGLGAGLEGEAENGQFNVLALFVLEGRNADQVGLECRQPGDLVHAVLNLPLVGGRGGAMLGQHLLGHALVDTRGLGQAQRLDQVVHRHAGAAVVVAPVDCAAPGSTTR